MPFEKGGPGGPGRPKGSKSIRTVMRAAEVLGEMDRHPIKELVKLADGITSNTLSAVAMKRDIWIVIQGYVEAPQDEPTSLVPRTPEESVENAAEIAKELAALSKPLEPPNAKP